MKTNTMQRGTIFAAVAALFVFGGATQLMADNWHYRGHDGYYDRHHHYNHYTYYHSHHGYWRENNGFRVFINLD